MPETSISRAIDRVLSAIGRTVSWLWLALLLVIVLNVIMRYLFNEGHIEFEEIQWHIYATGFLSGLSFAYQADVHIRVDALHERFSLRTKAWIELYGILLLLLPYIALILIYSVPFVMTSFNVSEVSSSPGGLPFRWLIKAMLPAGFTLLLLAVIARLSRVWATLFGSEQYGDSHGAE